MEKVLLIDSDPGVRGLVLKGLSSPQTTVFAVASPNEGLLILAEERPHVALIDVMTPTMDGLTLFRKIRAIDQKIPIIFVTADSSSETTIEAMRIGAYDYFAKPIQLEQLSRLTSSALEARRLMEQPLALTVAKIPGIGDRFLGVSSSMREVFKSIGRVSDQSIPVMIRGESGCGKELVARAIVQHSVRKKRPFLFVNCAAIPDQLLESELFGHEKGAFTGADKRRIGKFEECHGGTILLDEVGDMSPLVQGKVLRLLQDQCFQRLGGNETIHTDVRVLSATNRDLESLIASGEFRQDLFYRLNGYTISLPPLRKRQEDIPLLLEYFFQRARKEMGREQIEGFSPGAFKLLLDYSWPGNVRQFQSVVRQSLLHTSGTVVGPDSLPSFLKIHPDHEHASDNNPLDPYDTTSMGEIMVNASGATTPDARHQMYQDLHTMIQERMRVGSQNLYAEVLEDVERQLFHIVLSETAGNQSRAAEILGVTRAKVRDRILAFRIHVERTIISD